MVSVTSIIALLSLAIVVQLVHSSPAYVPPASLDRCQELKNLTLSNTTIAQAFDDQTLKAPIGFVYKGTVVNIVKSGRNNNKITNVQTGDLKSDQHKLRIDWQLADNHFTTRFFNLTEHKTCRVANSAEYLAIVGASYVKEV